MTQYNLTTANGSGLSVRTSFNDAAVALATNEGGATDPALFSPSSAFPHMLWADEGNNLLKQRTADNTAWVTVGAIKADGTYFMYQSVATLAAATTLNIGATNTNEIIVTGSTAITAFDTSPAGTRRILLFQGTPTITHSIGAIVLPNATSLTVSAGDSMEFISEGSGIWTCVNYNLQAVSNPVMIEESTGYGVISGLSTTVSGMTATVAAGIIHMASGNRYTPAQTTFTIPTADTTNPRIDLICVSSVGVVTYLAGTPSVNPVVPTLPSGGFSLSNVSVASNATTGVVIDTRIFKKVYPNMGFINPKDFGAKGDGSTDDTAPLQEALNSKSLGTLVVPDGTYMISSPLVVNKNVSIVMNRGSIIKASATMPYLISYNPSPVVSSIYDLAEKPEIRGGVYDGNDLVQDILSISQYKCMTISGVYIKNFLRFGIHTNAISGSQANLNFLNCTIENVTSHTGTYAIYNLGKDNMFSDVTIINVETGIWTNDGNFTRIHHWIVSPSLLSGSLFAYVNDSGASFFQCYSDSCRTAFYFAQSNIFCRICGLIIYFNESVWSSTLATTYPIILFKSLDSSTQLYVLQANITVPYAYTCIQYPSSRNFFTQCCDFSPNTATNAFLDCKTYVAGGISSGTIQTLLTPGVYACLQTVAGNIIGIPDNHLAGLLRVDASGSDVISHTFYVYNISAPYMYYRLYSSGAWLDWIKFNGAAM